MKNEKGITLTSLVTMIVIILILASIATYSGVGTIRYVNFNKAKAELQNIQSNVNKWKEEYSNGNDDVLNYGEDINSISSSLSQKVNDTFSNVQITDQIIKNEYRFFSGEYLKNNLSLDASFDYLVNIIKRDVILVGGILYNSRTYYTLKDFGIVNVEENMPNSISFNLEQGENTDIIISDLKLVDSNAKKSDISKFIVEYTKSGENNWKDITKDVVKFEEGEENNKNTKYKFSVADIGEYDVRISTIEKKLFEIGQVEIYEKKLTEEAPRIYVSTLDYTASSETDDSKILTIDGASYYLQEAKRFHLG